MFEQETLTGQVQDLLKKISIHTRYAMMKRFENEKITFHQFYILKTIEMNPNINYKVLGEKLNLAKSSISLMINKLVDEGYISRVEDSIDRRNKVLELTQYGKETIYQCKEMSRATFGTLIECINSDELLQIKNHLQILSDAINEKVKHEDFCGGSKNE